MPPRVGQLRPTRRCPSRRPTTGRPRRRARRARCSCCACSLSASRPTCCSRRQRAPTARSRTCAWPATRLPARRARARHRGLPHPGARGHEGAWPAGHASAARQRAAHQRGRVPPAPAPARAARRSTAVGSRRTRRRWSPRPSVTARPGPTEPSVDMVEEMTSLTFAIVGRTLFDSDLTGDARTFGDTLGRAHHRVRPALRDRQRALVRALPRGRRLLAKVDDLDAVVAAHDRRAPRRPRRRRRATRPHQLDDPGARHRGRRALRRDHDRRAAARRGHDDGARRPRDDGHGAVLDVVAAQRAPGRARAARERARHRARRRRRSAGPGATPTSPPCRSRAPSSRSRSGSTRPPGSWARRTLTDLQVGGWDVPSGSIVLALALGHAPGPAVLGPREQLRADPLARRRRRASTRRHPASRAAPGSRSASATAAASASSSRGPRRCCCWRPSPAAGAPRSSPGRRSRPRPRSPCAPATASP